MDNEYGAIILFREVVSKIFMRPISRWQEWRCERAHLYMLRHSVTYRERYVTDRWKAECDQFYASGESLKRPDWREIERRLPPMVWPNHPQLLI